LDLIEGNSMMTISRAGLAAALLVAASSAQAADMPAIEPIVAPATSAFNWTGFYAGAQIGYGWGNDNTVEYVTGTDILTGLAYELPSQGPLGGIFAGYNHQMNSIVIGGEADIEAADIRGDFGDEITGVGAGASHIDWQGSVRARLGFTATDRALVYLTGGVAFANINYVYSRTALIPPAVDEPVTNFRTGWTVGAGLEYALTENVTVRGEYRYTDYGTFRNESKIAFGPGVVNAAGLTAEQDPTTSTVRLGIAYKF